MLLVCLQAARERFNEFMQMASLPAEEADVERVRRERREAAAKDGIKLSEGDLPDRFYKLPRIRFLLLLCKELLRINRCDLPSGSAAVVYCWTILLDCCTTSSCCMSAAAGFLVGIHRFCLLQLQRRHITTYGEDRFLAMVVHYQLLVSVWGCHPFSEMCY
jgi:hypothetical protein